MKHPHNREHLKEYLEGIIAGKYKQMQVALWTGYTREHICRLTKRYKQEGEACLINGHKGKVGPRAIPQEVKNKIVAIYKEDFVSDGEGTQFSVFRDCLELDYGINYSYRAVYNVLAAAGIDSPEKRRVKRKKAHRPRQRKASEGELVQVDASPFEWFKRLGDNERRAMHGAIDDATGKIVSLFLAKNESSYGYYSLLEQAIQKHGLPANIYSDRSAIFCASPKDKEKLTVQEQLEGVHEKRTQLQRVLSDLEIGQILAWSPQAKGRIERLWRTLQARLPVIFKLRGIRTMEEANRFLRDEFIPAFNAKFAVPARKPPVWREPPQGWQKELCNRIGRKANGASVVSYMNHKLLVKADCACRNVELCVYRDRIRALYKGRFYDVELVEEPRGRSHAPAVLREIIGRTLKANGKAGSD